LIVGAICWFFTQSRPKKTDPPRLRLCVPRCQDSVSSMFQFDALRQLCPVCWCQLVSVLPMLPSESA